MSGEEMVEAVALRPALAYPLARSARLEIGPAVALPTLSNVAYRPGVRNRGRSGD